MKTFLIVWAGQLVSTLGSGLTSFALGVWVFEETGSATLFAITAVVWALPRVVLSPIAGMICDRWDRRHVMLLSDTGAGVSSLLVILVLVTGELQVWHVYLASLINSAFTTFQWPAYSAATSLMVPKKHLSRAAGMSQIGEAVSMLAAPAIAGALYVSAGLRPILYLDVLTYLVALLSLVAVRFPQPDQTQDDESTKGGFWREALFGWWYIRQRPGLLGLLMVFAVMNFLMSITFALYTPLVLGITTPDMLGYINGIGGLGMLVGTLVMSAWGGPRRLIYGIVAAETVLGVTTTLFGLGLTVPLMALNNLIFLASMPITNGCSQAIWQKKVAPEVQGRVFAMRTMIAYSIMPLAYAVAGPLADQLFEPLMTEEGALAPLFGPLLGTGPGRGIALIFALMGLLYILITQVILLHPRIRRVELELPDALPEAQPE